MKGLPEVSSSLAFILKQHWGRTLPANCILPAGLYIAKIGEVGGAQVEVTVEDRVRLEQLLRALDQVFRKASWILKHSGSPSRGIPWQSRGLDWFVHCLSPGFNPWSGNCASQTAQPEKGKEEIKPIMMQC